MPLLQGSPKKLLYQFCGFQKGWLQWILRENTRLDQGWEPTAEQWEGLAMIAMVENVVKIAILDFYSCNS